MSRDVFLRLRRSMLRTPSFDSMSDQAKAVIAAEQASHAKINNGFPSRISSAVKLPSTNLFLLKVREVARFEELSARTGKPHLRKSWGEDAYVAFCYVEPYDGHREWLLNGKPEPTIDLATFKWPLV
jgi:hypothetical protein